VDLSKVQRALYKISYAALLSIHLWSMNKLTNGKFTIKEHAFGSWWKKPSDLWCESQKCARLGTNMLFNMKACS
jgi:hypothetical protein